MFHKDNLGVGHRQDQRDRFLQLMSVSMALYGSMNINVKLIPYESFSKKLKTKVLAQGNKPQGPKKCPNTKEIYYFQSRPGMYYINFFKNQTLSFLSNFALEF